MTAQNLFKEIKALFDELSNKGVLISEEKTKDMELKAIEFLSMAQREIYDMGNYFKVFTHIQTPFENQLDENFDIKTFTGTDFTTEGVNAKAYYFEIDDDSTVTIQELIGETWTPLEVLTCTSSDGFTPYRGSITTSRKVRLVFSGTTFYRYRNIAMWDILFKVIPDYGEWIQVELPDDFMNIADIVEITEEDGYLRKGDYKLEGQRNMFVTNNFEGIIRMTYHPVPPKITSLDDEIVVDDIHSDMMVYYAASKIAPSEQPSLTNYFEEKYQLLRVQLRKPVQNGFTKIKDVYNIGKLGGI